MVGKSKATSANVQGIDFPLQPWHLMPLFYAGPLPSSLSSGVWLPVYHRSWILCLKYLDNLYNCCPFAHMCSCQAALIHRSLKTQEFGLALTLAPTKPQLDLPNIPTKSHMDKHIHMPAHTQMVHRENRTVQQNRTLKKQHFAPLYRIPSYHTWDSLTL